MEIGTQTLVPISETALGENFVFRFRRIVLDATPFTFSGDPTADTIYWNALRLTAENSDFLGSNAGIETTITNTPNGFHTYITNAREWEFPIDLVTGSNI